MNTNKNFLQKIRAFAVAHKFWSAVIIIVVVFLGYEIFKGSAKVETKYVLSTVQKGSVIVSVDDTGQVSASNQVDLTSKASGAITYVGVTAGQSVKAGTLIAQVDSSNAKIALENAQLSLQKLTTVDPLSLLQQQDSLKQSQQSLKDNYDNTLSVISKAMLDLPSIVNNLDTLYGTGYLGYKNTSRLSNSGRAYISTLEQSYYDAQSALNTNQTDALAASQSSDTATLDKLIAETATTAQDVSQALKDAQTAVNYVSNYNNDVNSSDSTTTLNNITTWTNTATGYVSDLLTAQSTIKSENNSISESNVSISTLQNPNAIDLQTAQLNVEQAQNAYNNYFVYAPFDGIVAAIDVKVGDSASGTIATLVTKQELADISLNEVDVAKISLGDKATLTFDAIPNLTITGTVAQIDTIGTVSQGVVTYNAEINFDTNDARVKPGMSVSASIITNVKTDVLTVPNGAIKTQGGISYVAVFNPPLSAPSGASASQGVASITPPQEVPVTLGLVNDTVSEIVSGLNEGDQIVTRTIASTTTTASASTTPSLLGAVAGNRAAGGGGGFGGGGGGGTTARTTTTTGSTAGR